MAAIDPLLGTAFEGYLTPPGGPKCRVKYEFSGVTKLAMPSGVKVQRRQLGWICTDAVKTIEATCSVPSLGLQNEHVVVSADPEGANGDRLLLLQSLERPELGLTVLVLSRGGQEIYGGDESWSPGDPPIIKVSRVETGGSSPSKPLAKAEPSKPVDLLKSVQISEPESVHGYPPKAPAPSKAGAAPAASDQPSSLSKMQMQDDDFRDPRDAQVGAWRSHSEGAGPHAPADGGVGRSVMGAAAEQRHAPSKISTADASLLHEPKPSTDSNSIDQEILAAKLESVERLVSAAAAGEIGDMKMLSAKVGVNAAGSESTAVRQAGLTPLMAAAEKGRVEAVNFLLQQGADLNAADPQGWTAVMHSISKQRTEVLKALLHAKASAVVNSADEGMTPLHLAAMGARVELVSLLLGAPLPPAAREAKDAEGRTALHVAAKNGRNASLMAIMKAKGRIEATDNEGRTPLLCAAESGHSESVRILLSAGADASVKNIDGKSAIDLAQLWGHERVLEVLKNPDAAS